MITSEANSLRVEFESDSSVHKTGFAAVFFIGKKIVLIAALFLQRSDFLSITIISAGHQIKRLVTLSAWVKPL